MKKNFIYVAIACATVFAFNSCGNKDAKSSEKATEQTTEVSSQISSLDKAIDEYEKFILEDYIPALKGATSGDMSFVTKLQELTPKLQEIAEKFSDTSSYTPKQIQRLTDIAQKITDATTAQ